MEYAVYSENTGIVGLGRIHSKSDTWYPDRLAEITSSSQFRDFRACNLVTYPVQVNPLRKEARIYSNIIVEIHFENSNDPLTQYNCPDSISSTFLPWYRQFLDWEESELDEFEIMVVARKTGEPQAAGELSARG